jgi:Bacterial Ig-like domain (group 3)
VLKGESKSALLRVAVATACVLAAAAMPARADEHVDTTTSVTSSPTPSLWGQTLTYTAKVQTASGSAVPAGHVQFYGPNRTPSLAANLTTDGVAAVTDSNENGGYASRFRGPGTYTIVAVYSGGSIRVGGDTRYYNRSEGATTQTIGRAPSTATLRAETIHFGKGGPSGTDPGTWAVVAFTLDVSSPSARPGYAPQPDGTVEFYEGNTRVASVPNLYRVLPNEFLNSATWYHYYSAHSESGDHTITARYLGNSTFEPSTAAPVTVNVPYAGGTGGGLGGIGGAFPAVTPSALRLPRAIVPVRLAAGKADVQARCGQPAGDFCAMRADVLLGGPKASPSRRRRKARKAGTLAGRIPGQQNGALVLRLNRAGRKALTKAKLATATVKGTLASTAGSSVYSGRLRLRAAVRKGGK